MEDKLYADYDLVKWALHDSGWTIAKLKDHCEVSWTTISDLKKGRENGGRDILDTNFLLAVKLTRLALDLQKEIDEEWED